MRIQKHYTPYAIEFAPLLCQRCDSEIVEVDFNTAEAQRLSKEADITFTVAFVGDTADFLVINIKNQIAKISPYTQLVGFIKTLVNGR